MSTLMNERKTGMTELEAACCAGVRSLRKSLGMSQEAFARHVGCSERTLIRWEQGAYVPQGRFLPRLKTLAEMFQTLDTRDQPTGRVEFRDGVASR